MKIRRIFVKIRGHPDAQIPVSWKFFQNHVQNQGFVWIRGMGVYDNASLSVELFLLADSQLTRHFLSGFPPMWIYSIDQSWDKTAMPRAPP